MITRALNVKQPFAELIMRGKKKIEYRTRPTKIRERVYIYATCSFAEREVFEEFGLKPDDVPGGVIVGSVEIVGCTKGKGRATWYEWHLAKPVRLKMPFKPKNHPQPVWFSPL